NYAAPPDWSWIIALPIILVFWGVVAAPTFFLAEYLAVGPLKDLGPLVWVAWVLLLLTAFLAGTATVFWRVAFRIDRAAQTLTVRRGVFLALFPTTYPLTAFREL